MNFTELKNYLENLPKEYNVPACSMTVRVGHDVVFEDYINAKPDDVYWLYSATKVFTATMFCRLLEQGKIKLEDKVSDYLPEYAHLKVMDRDKNIHDAVKEPTLLNIITMCGGLTYNIFSPYITNATDRTTRGIVREIAKMPLWAEPGEIFMYSLCHDVVAAVCEVVTGKRFAELIKDEITDPLGMTSTAFQPDEKLSARIAPQYKWNNETKMPDPCEKTNKFRFSDSYDSGGAGLCSTMDDYVLLPEALANNGLSKDGYQLLKPKTIDLMRKNHLTDAQREGLLRIFGRLRGYSYGLGVRTRTNYSDNGLSPIGEFGWDGAAGAFCVIDPENNISAFYVQHVLDMGPIYDPVHQKLRDLIYKGFKA